MNTKPKARTEAETGAKTEKRKRALGGARAVDLRIFGQVNPTSSDPPASRLPRSPAFLEFPGERT